MSMSMQADDKKLNIYHLRQQQILILIERERERERESNLRKLHPVRVH